METEYSKTHKTKVQDFLERIGLEDCYFHSDYKKIGINKIKEKIDYFLNNDVYDSIIQKMNAEGTSINNFLEIFKNLERKGDN